MKLRCQIITVFLTVLFFNVYGQPPQTAPLLPKLLPASPEATSISKFGSYEVNMYSGLPNISIPLYEIQVGQLRVPITLSYHASGIKVSDVAPWVGLGWGLSAGGTISRKVMGRPDELEAGYLSNSNPVKITSNINQYSQTDLDYLKNVVDGHYDVEPDVYSYNVPGKGGRFLFNQPNSFSPIIMPYDPIKITRTQTGSSTQIFSITDESGILYRFDSCEWTSTSISSVVNNDAVSSWMLSNMISANKQDTIYFSYSTKTGSGNTDYYVNETFVINDNSTDAGVYQNDYGTPYSSIVYTTINWKLNSEIKFRNGKIVFEQAAESREDFNSSLNLPKRLSAIKVYSYDNLTNSYKLIRVIKLYHSYFVSGSDASTKRLRLDSVAILNSSETEAQKYKFEYNTSISLPAKTSMAIDYWGYYNNASNSSLIPRMQISYLDYTGQSTNVWIGSSISDGREPNPSYNQAYILNKIIFPTGGNTQFEYETNQYLDAQNNPKYAGGLRIKKIRSYDGISSIPIVKTYKYGMNESGYGRANFILNNYFFGTTQTNRYWFSIGQGYCPSIVATKRVRTYLSNPTIDIEPYDGIPVAYATVTEYLGNDTTNIGKTKYDFNDHADGMNVVAAYGKPIITSYHFGRGQLIKKINYKRLSGSSYQKLDSTINTYEAFSEQWNSYQGLVVFKQFVNDGLGSSNNYCPPDDGMNCGCYDTYSYQYSNYSIRTGDNKLVSTIETVFDPDDLNKSITTGTNYYYDNFNHQQVTRKVTTNSFGETLIDSLKYPHDFSGQTPYSNMISANIINKVVQERKTNNGTQISLSKTNYYNWGNNNFLPQTIEFQKGGNANETRASFTKYDSRANPQEMMKSNDVKQSYIWNYQNLLVSAEVINAAESDIAATSFEGDGNGNWSFTGLKFTDGSAPTGYKVYNLGTGNITRTISTAGNYIVSYWSKNGAQNVNSTSSTSGRTLNSTWTYYEHKLTLSANGTVTVSGSGIIDELRLYPEKALMKTITFTPLVGVTSECDANNRIQYYEYDEFNRLILIRDQDKNVIKKVCYNYNGQVENCNIYYNSAQSGNYTRSCQSGYTGSSVTYTVPANTYSSTVSSTEANNKAIADVQANGQNYANAIGTCTAPPVTVQGYNTQSKTYKVRFTNNSTSQVTDFLLNANTYSTVTLGTLASGSYTVSFFLNGSPPPVTCTYNINGYTYYGTGATFYNVSITSTSTAAMY